METGLFCILVKYTHPNSFAVDLAPLLCPICFVPPLPPPLSMAQLLQNIFNATGQSIDSVGGEFITTISKYINRAQLYINNSSEKVKNVLKTYLEYFDIYNNKDDDGEENAINDYVNNKRDTLKRINRLNAWQGENNMNNIDKKLCKLALMPAADIQSLGLSQTHLKYCQLLLKSKTNHRISEFSQSNVSNLRTGNQFTHLIMNIDKVVFRIWIKLRKVMKHFILHVFHMCFNFFQRFK